MSDRTVETPWGSVSAAPTTLPGSTAVHGTTQIEIPTGSGTAVAAFATAFTAAMGDDDTIPELVRVTLFGKFSDVTGQSGAGALDEPGQPVVWEAVANIDPFSDGLPEDLPIGLALIGTNGYPTFGDETVRERLRSHVREALGSGIDQDPSFLPGVYNAMMENYLPGLAQELEAAKTVLRRVETRMQRAHQVMELASDRTNSPSGPTP